MAKMQKSAEPKESVLRDVKEVAAVEQYWQTGGMPNLRKPRKKFKYVDELAHLSSLSNYKNGFGCTASRSL